MARRGSLSSTSLCIAGVLVAVAAVACGSSGDSTFGDGNGGAGDPNAGTSGNTAFGGTSGGVVDPNAGTSGGTSGGVGTVKPVSATDACASSNAGVDALPIYLVFMVDKSGSMGGASLGVKWTPAVAALKDFFADPTSANIHASLAFFAQSPNSNIECNVSLVRDARGRDEGAPGRDRVRSGAQRDVVRAAVRPRCPPSRAPCSTRRPSRLVSRPERRSLSSS